MSEQFRNVKAMILNAHMDAIREHSETYSLGMGLSAHQTFLVSMSLQQNLSIPSIVSSVEVFTGSYDNLFDFVATETTSIEYTGYIGNVTQIAPGNTDSEAGTTWITRNGGTFRLEQPSAWTDNARTRAVTNKHLSGFVFVVNTISNVYIIDIALDPGTYRVRMGMGFDTSFTEGDRTKVIIRDGMSSANILQTLTVDASGTNFGCGVDGIRTHTNSYLALGFDNEPYLDLTLTNSFMRFEMGYADGSIDSSAINYIRLKRIS